MSTRHVPPMKWDVPQQILQEFSSHPENCCFAFFTGSSCSLGQIELRPKSVPLFFNSQVVTLEFKVDWKQLFLSILVKKKCSILICSKKYSLFKC